MKKICILSGPALGHIGRLFKVAERIREYGEINIHFLIPARCTFADQVLADKFTYALLPDDGEGPLDSAERFAAAVEAHFRDYSYHMIILDANPMLWFSVIRFPDVPRVFITNAFLTRINAANTVQSKFFAKHGAQLNNLREIRGIAPLSNAYDLYEANKVLLSDPLALVDHLGTRPKHYIACGSCSWEFKGTLPGELAGLNQLMLLSMGSTGPTEINANFLSKVSNITRSQGIVYAGSRASSSEIRELVNFAYEWLPLSQIIPKCAAVVSQGGAGSSYQALLLGCPLFVVGRHQNHAILADILQEMGLALRLDSPNVMEYLDEGYFDQLKIRVARFADNERNNDGAMKMSEEVYKLLSVLV